MFSSHADIDLHRSRRSDIFALELLRLPLGVDQLSFSIKLQERPTFVGLPRTEQLRASNKCLGWPFS